MQVSQFNQKREKKNSKNSVFFAFQTKENQSRQELQGVIDRSKRASITNIRTEEQSFLYNYLRT